MFATYGVSPITCVSRLTVSPRPPAYRVLRRLPDRQRISRLTVSPRPPAYRVLRCLPDNQRISRLTVSPRLPAYIASYSAALRSQAYVRALLRAPRCLSVPFPFAPM